MGRKSISWEFKRSGDGENSLLRDQGIVTRRPFALQLTKVNISTQELSGGARIYYTFNDVFGSVLRAIDFMAFSDSLSTSTEWLGPTSEYTQTLIDIQAAHINMNHPAFVAGSGNALVMGMAAAKNQKPPVELEQSSSSSTSTSTVASTSTDTSTTTTATARVPSISRPPSDDSADDTDSGVREPFPSPSRFHRIVIAETFLNYFFGAGVEKKALVGGKMSMPSFGVFDIKSLAKAVDAPPLFTTSLPSPSPSARTDLQTTLIRSLVPPTSLSCAKRSKILSQSRCLHLLVNFTSSAVQNRLVAELYKPEVFGGMLSEDGGGKAKRDRVRGFWRRIGEARGILGLRWVLSGVEG
ncbi:Dynamin-related GTPase protein [Marasmius crinis-equi]|uniref:Dynamin-related GTPase protein n=1 Tax=Marasmius crinis-equi TaxID=585013 RepID=A0ABR3F8K0_9AGAR